MSTTFSESFSSNCRDANDDRQRISRSYRDALWFTNCVPVANLRFDDISYNRALRDALVMRSVVVQQSVKLGQKVLSGISIE